MLRRYVYITYGMDGSRLTLHDGTPMGARRQKEARKTQNHMENHEGGNTNARMEVSSHRAEQNGYVCIDALCADCRHEEGR